MMYQPYPDHVLEFITHLGWCGEYNWFVLYRIQKLQDGLSILPRQYPEYQLIE